MLLFSKNRAKAVEDCTWIHNHIFVISPFFFFFLLAQNEFARLMGLEDSSPVTTENEGLDSGLGEAPQTSDKKMTDDVEPGDTEMSTHKTGGKIVLPDSEKDPVCAPTIPDETEQQPLRNTLKKKKKKKDSPEKILDEKQKKSLEKVAEWLMKVPAEGSLELEKPDDKEDDSDSCSSTSTIDVRQHNIDMCAQREDRAKALEEQVFGAVYKRERKGNRTSCHLYNGFQDTERAEIVSKRGKKIKSTAAELGSEEEEDSITEKEQQITEVRDVSSDFFKKTEGVKTKQTHTESDQTYTRDEVPCLMTETEQHEPERQPKKRARNPVQEVDSDLQQQDETEQKKTSKRKKVSKSARVPKPLDLVQIQNGDTSLTVRPKAGEVQVHIENYPSSGDQEVSITRSIRKSKRLQQFTEEVKGGNKRANLTSRGPENQSDAAKQSVDGKDQELDQTDSPKKQNITEVTGKNGCIYDEDLGGIENMESERTPDMKTAEEEPINKTMMESSAPYHVHVVPNTTSPTEASMVGPTPEIHDLTQQLPNVESSACVTKCKDAELEDEKNDSEVETEQLLKSFKATKRKSFHLGGPGVKRGRNLEEESPKLEEGKHAKSAAETTEQEASRDNENSSCSDLIPPSHSPGVTRKKDQVVEASVPEMTLSGQDHVGGNFASMNSVSSVLPPNKESKCEIQSQNLSVVPQVVDSGLCYVTVEPEETESSQITEIKTTSRVRRKVKDSVKTSDSSRSRRKSVKAAEPVLESSLTPEGLDLPVAPTDLEAKTTTNASGDLSLHSSIKSRKRRRTQKLKPSSSESDCSEEELPTLKDILGTSAPSFAETTKSNEAYRCENVSADGANLMINPPEGASCDSSSQGSEDLFGTPEECELLVRRSKKTTMQQVC